MSSEQMTLKKFTSTPGVSNVKSMITFTEEQKQKICKGDQAQMINLFRSYDKKNTGSIEERDFNNILRNLGYMDVSDSDIEQMISGQSRSEMHKVSW